MINLETEKEIQKEWSILSQGDFVTIKISADKFADILKQKTGEIKVVFKKMTCGEYWEIEKQSESKDDVDMQEMRKLLLKHRLYSWNLAVPLEFNEEHHLTEDCFKRITFLPAKILSFILDKYEESFSITKKEKEQVDKQSSILFSKDSKGVDEPCEAISLYCVLSNFWERFGLNRFDIKNLSYKEYMLLRMMSGKDNEAKEREFKSHEKKNKPVTNVFGPGGRTSPSRGKYEPMPGSK